MEETRAQKGESISSRSNGTSETAVELKLFKRPVREAYCSPTAALGSWEISRAGPRVGCPGIWGLSGVGDIQTEPDVLSVSVSPPRQQAETLKKGLPWQRTFLPE